jgi:hypothetical protein
MEIGKKNVIRRLFVMLAAYFCRSLTGPSRFAPKHKSRKIRVLANNLGLCRVLARDLLKGGTNHDAQPRDLAGQP